MSRIVPFNSDENNNISVDVVFESVERIGEKYENGFLTSLMSYIKTDSTLRYFYIRFIYECEIVKKLTNLVKTDSIDPTFLSMIEMTVLDMNHSDSIESIAIYDSQFHRNMFVVAGEQEFFNWFKLNSENLQCFLENFWKVVGLGTDYYKELIKIHNDIFKYISEANEAKAIESVQKHFAILLLNLLGMMF